MKPFLAAWAMMATAIALAVLMSPNQEPEPPGPAQLVIVRYEPGPDARVMNYSSLD